MLQEMPISETRTIRSNDGDYTINIPKEIIEKRGLKAGDEIGFIDEPEGDEPEVIWPGKTDHKHTRDRS